MEVTATKDRKQAMTVASPAGQIAARLKELTEKDAQFREALPHPASMRLK